MRGLQGSSHKEVQQAFHELNCGCLDTAMITMAAGDDGRNWLMDFADELATQIFETQAMPETIDENLFRGYSRILMNGLTSGYATNGHGDDIEMIKALQTNVYQFSSAKVYTQMKALTEALVDDEGKLRSLSAFKIAAYQINDEHINQWLEAEYNNAVAASQMASKWVDIQQQVKTLPNLQYVTAGDARVRPEHAAMDGIVLPANDPFWNNFYPPNGWNCRCTVKQLGNGAAVTPAADVVHPDLKDVPKIFRFNPGKDQVVFPPDHPYFKDLPKSVLDQAKKPTI